MIILSLAWAMSTSISAGGGFVATDVPIGGLNGRAYLNFGERFCVGPEISVFGFAGEHSPKIDVSVNAHYILEVQPWLGVYPIGGVGFALEIEDDHTRAVPNGRIGGGFHATYRRLSPFLEGQFIISEELEGAAVLGVLMHFGSKDRTSDPTDSSFRPR